MKILAAQYNPTVGDLDGNYEKMATIINANANHDLIVFPELAITGYPPLDLIERKSFYARQMEILNAMAGLTLNTPCAVIVGFFEKNNKGVGKPFYNAMAVLHNGTVACVYYKRLLPTYNIFDESRHFESGDGVGVFVLNGIRIGLLICEDMWNDKAITTKPIYPINPVEETAKAGVDLIVSINASPSNIGKPQYRLEKFAKICSNYKVPLLYVNQVGGNDDIVFDGTSFAINGDGNVAAVAQSFEQDSMSLVFESGFFGKRDSAFKPNFIIDSDLLAGYADSLFYFKQIVLGIRDYVQKCGFKKVVIASSGGVDSALVLALAVEAVGNENVVAITMPSAISSTGSVSDSEILCKNLGVKLYNYPIANAVSELMVGFDKTFGESTRSLTKENLQARIRGMILMGFTNEFPEFLPLSTGNKSECAVGYCTIYGDMSGGLAPISDLYKTEVWKLCKFYNTMRMEEVIPNAIIDKAPSAELYEGQKDTDSLPPYPVLDSILLPYIEGNEIAPEIVESCKRFVAESGFNQLEKIYRMVDKAEFKRRQAAPTIRVHQKAWGSGRRLPIVQKSKP